ncbi:MAG: ATP-binding protein [Clostridia bacterium]|nr:ATP-binding protein [Clostridia bacterium]MBT7122156.1 ATP-binding protein [Clostridia bacterium]
MSISDVLSEYSRIRAKNETELERRVQQVYDAVPELKKIDEQKNALQLKRISQALDGKPIDTSDILALREKKNMLMIGAGFDSKYLDPIYSCNMCRDTGSLDNSLRCECFKKRVLEDKLDAAKLTDTDVSFELFDLNVFDDSPLESGKSQRETMQRIKQITSKYADAYPHCEPILLLSGSTGLGKTFVAKCVMRRVIERGYTAAFYTAYRLFSMFHSHRLGEEVDLDPVFTVPMLIIDDVGTEPMTRNVTVEYFFDLINERTAAGLHTAIVTNLAFHDIKDRYGDRIHSRLMDKSTAIKIIFSGDDIRY